MARILIFDSAATVDSAGAAINMSFVGRGAGYQRTKAVRCFGAPDGDGRNVAFEFELAGGTSGSYDVHWFMEFFNDAPSLLAQPDVRSNGLPWSREQSAEATGGSSTGQAQVDHYNVRRTIQNMDNSGAGDSRIFPMVAQTLWVRLALASPNLAAAVSEPRLKVYALVGGYDSQAVLQAGTAPYAGT